VHLQTEHGKVAPTSVRLRNSSTVVYYRAASDTGWAQIIATADDHHDTLTLALAPAGGQRVLSGVVVDDSTEMRLPLAVVMIDDSLRASTDDNGGFFAADVLPGEHELTVAAKGYTMSKVPVMIEPARSAVVPVRLKANLSGLLHNEPIILDAALGGNETGDMFNDSFSAAAANLALARRLADTLRWAGANVVMLREDHIELPVAVRIDTVNKLSTGWYMKLNYRRWDSDSILVQSTIYPANRVAEQIATAINTSFTRLPRVRAVLRQNTAVPEVNLTNKTALEVMIASRMPAVATRDLPALYEGIVNYIKEKKRKLESEEY
jgi:N-acetylmuramoyl-L-alanine amidase